MPKVSVILTSYNHAQFIGQAIASVLKQNFEDFELLILDDASSDESVSVIKTFRDPRITLVESEKPQQVITGLNRLIMETARGEFIAIHHSDDMWLPEKLGKQVRYLEEHPDVGAVFTQVDIIDKNSELVVDASNVYTKVFQSWNRTRYMWLRHFFCFGNALCHPSALVRKLCYADCGAYGHGAVGLGDFHMWVRLCMRHNIHILPERLTLFRYFDDLSNASGDREEFHVCSAVTYFNTLKEYKKITSFDELCAVFPEAREFDRGTSTNVAFALAMVTLRLSPYRFAKLIAIEILYDLLENEDTRICLIKEYGFERNAFAALIREADPFGLAERTAIINESAKEHEKFCKLNERIAELEKATARPLYKIAFERFQTGLARIKKK